MPRRTLDDRSGRRNMTGNSEKADKRVEANIQRRKGGVQNVGINKKPGAMIIEEARHLSNGERALRQFRGRV